MEWFLLGASIVIALIGLISAHHNGYRQGRKDGFELGKKRINEYALKVNQAQGERIKELQSQRNGDIHKMAHFLTKNIERK